MSAAAQGVQPVLATDSTSLELWIRELAESDERRSRRNSGAGGRLRLVVKRAKTLRRLFAELGPRLAIEVVVYELGKKLKR